MIRGTIQVFKENQQKVSADLQVSIVYTQLLQLSNNNFNLSLIFNIQILFRL